MLHQQIERVRGTRVWTDFGFRDGSVEQCADPTLQQTRDNVATPQWAHRRGSVSGFTVCTLRQCYVSLNRLRH